MEEEGNHQRQCGEQRPDSLQIQGGPVAKRKVEVEGRRAGGRGHKRRKKTRVDCKTSGEYRGKNEAKLSKEMRVIKWERVESREKNKKGILNCDRQTEREGKGEENAGEEKKMKAKEASVAGLASRHSFPSVGKSNSIWGTVSEWGSWSNFQPY